MVRRQPKYKWMEREVHFARIEYMRRRTQAWAKKLREVCLRPNFFMSLGSGIQIEKDSIKIKDQGKDPLSV